MTELVILWAWLYVIVTPPLVIAYSFAWWMDSRMERKRHD